MQEELNQLVATRDVIVLTSLDETATCWFIEQFRSRSGIQIVENAHQFDTEKILDLCRTGVNEGRKIIFSAQFRSQLPVINIASVCNEKHKKLINIDLSGWDKEKAEPTIYRSF